MCLPETVVKVGISVFLAGIKLILFIVCRRVATPSAQALSQDHRNDVISNTGAVVCGLIGKNFSGCIYL